MLFRFEYKWPQTQGPEIYWPSPTAAASILSWTRGSYQACSSTQSKSLAASLLFLSEFSNVLFPEKQSTEITRRKDDLKMRPCTQRAACSLPTPAIHKVTVCVCVLDGRVWRKSKVCLSCCTQTCYWSTRFIERHGRTVSSSDLFCKDSQPLRSQLIIYQPHLTVP